MNLSTATCGRLLGVLIGTLLMPGLGLAGKAEVEWSGEYRVRAEAREDADLDRDLDDERIPILQRVRLGAAVKVSDPVAFLFQVQDSRAFGSEASTASNESNVDLHQGYLRLSPSDRFELTVGREEWSYGAQRLIGAFGWDNVGRAFDGVRARGKCDKGWVDGFWGRLSRFLDPTENERNQDLFGLYGHFAPGASYVVEPYLLAFRSGEEGASEIPEVMGTSRVVAFGVHGNARWQRTEASFEAVYETGEVSGDDLSAQALAVTASHRFGDDELWIKPLAGYDFASGDEDPTDGERQEFFNFFPTNHLHYGYLDLFGWRNLSSPWGGVAIGGKGNVVQLKVHCFWLDEERGRWSSAGGATLGFDADGASGTRVGTEVDVTYKRTFFDVLQLHVGLSRFDPEEFAEATLGQDPAYLGYLEGTVSF